MLSNKKGEIMSDFSEDKISLIQHKETEKNVNLSTRTLISDINKIDDSSKSSNYQTILNEMKKYIYKNMFGTAKNFGKNSKKVSEFRQCESVCRINMMSVDSKENNNFEPIELCD